MDEETSNKAARAAKWSIAPDWLDVNKQSALRNIEASSDRMPVFGTATEVKVDSDGDVEMKESKESQVEDTIIVTGTPGAVVNKGKQEVDDDDSDSEAEGDRERDGTQETTDSDLSGEWWVSEIQTYDATLGFFLPQGRKQANSKY